MDISIKFALQKKSGVEMRRVRGAYTLAELQSVAAQWWECPNLRWQYRDPEGDMVTMTTEPEWAECVRLAGGATSATPIRITICKAGKAPVPSLAVDALPAMVAAAVEATSVDFPGHGCRVVDTDLRGLRGYGQCGRFRCDVCDRKGTGRSFHCGRCGYDVCDACMAAFQEAMGPAAVKSAASPSAVPTCRSGCKLTPYKSASWQCDVCNGHGSVSMACRSCNFDMCEACYARVDATHAPVTAATTVCLVVDTDLRGPTGYTERDVGEAPQESVMAVPIPTLVFPVVADAPTVVTVVPAAAVTTVVPAATTTDPKCATLMAVFPSLDAATAAEILGLANGNVRKAIEMFLGA